MEIPGYKWDRERKRYFKVLKTGELPNSRYTVSALASKDRRSRRSLAKQEKGNNSTSETQIINQNVLRLGSRSRAWYVGGPTEYISSFEVTSRGLLAGSRDGTIAFGGWRSEQGRSIVDVSVVDDTPVIAAVDNEEGSFVCYGSESRRIKGQFATQVKSMRCGSDPAIGIGSQRGLNVWRPNVPSSSIEVMKVGSVSALSRSGCSADTVVGCRDGSIKMIDMRSSTSPTAGSLGSNKMVTNVAALTTRPAILATGLEDQMMLFDVRKIIEPVCQFNGYENWSTSVHGFALSPDNESVAVALDTGLVEIFDVYTGNRVKQLHQNNKHSRLGPAPPTKMTQIAIPAVSCIRWTPEGLFMAAENKIRAFPSGLQDHSTQPTDEYIDMLTTVHSNINFT